MLAQFDMESIPGFYGSLPMKERGQRGVNKPTKLFPNHIGASLPASGDKRPPNNTSLT